MLTQSEGKWVQWRFLSKVDIKGEHIFRWDLLLNPFFFQIAVQDVQNL